MSQPPEMPAPDGQVADAYSGNWVDHRAPAWSRPYLRLSRADRPIGTWLLFLPCLWGVMLAMALDGARPVDLWIVIGCGIGSFVMRGAGCTWNDLTDRKIDAQVERTRSRPLASGQVSVLKALVWLAVQALIGLAILLTFNAATIVLGIVSLVPVAIYPFAKRLTWWPQLFLGIAFNWGVLVGWVAHRGQLEWPAVALYLAGVFWTLFYDTIYAHQDKEDDALIGVKSTARLFEHNTPVWLRRFLVGMVLMMGLAVVFALTEADSVLVLVIALGGPWAMGWHLVWQMRTLDIDNPDNCMRVFRSNRNAGLIPVLFFAAALIV